MKKAERKRRTVTGNRGEIHSLSYNEIKFDFLKLGHNIDRKRIRTSFKTPSIKNLKTWFIFTIWTLQIMRAARNAFWLWFPLWTINVCLPEALTIRTQLSSAVSCPNGEFIAPCSCRSMAATGIHVICLRVPSQSDLKRVFSVLQDYQVGTLIIQQTNLSYTNWTEPLFKGLNVKNLRLADCSLPSQALLTTQPPQYLLNGLESSLNRLDIVHCRLDENGVPLLGLKHISTLHEININREAFNVIKKIWFHNGSPRPGSRAPNWRPHITMLRLEQSSISLLEDNVFECLKDLTILSLAKNNITSLKRTMMPTNSDLLQTLDLSTNRISSLPEDIFIGMTRLKKVLLYQNSITCVDENTWSPVWSQLETLWFNGNPLVCDYKIRWLSSKISHPNILEGICVEPSDMMGTSLTSISSR